MYTQNIFSFPGSVAETMAHPETAPVPDSRDDIAAAVTSIIEYVNANPEGVEAVAIYAKRLSSTHRLQVVSEMANISGRTNEAAIMATLTGKTSREVLRETSREMSQAHADFKAAKARTI